MKHYKTIKTKHYPGVNNPIYFIQVALPNDTKEDTYKVKQVLVLLSCTHPI